MREIVRFSAVNAKIDKMYSDLLKDTDYIKLAHMDNVGEISKYLMENSQIGKDFERAYDRTYEAELCMQRYKIKQLKKLTHYLTDDYKVFVNALLYEFEISDIKKVLRILQRNEKIDEKDLSSKLLIMNKDPHFKLDSDMDIPTFINSLKNTRYYRVLQSYQDEEKDVILFYMEMNLDKLYYSTLVNAAKGFSTTDKECVKQILGRKIDLLNIEWIYRGMKYYKLLPEELINFCILGGCKFKYDNLKDFCYLETLDDFVEAIKKTDYKFLFFGTKTDIYLDRRSSRYLYYIAKKEFVKSTFSVGKLISYAVLLRSEVKDISAIMETTRFNISFEETLKYLVRSYKGSEI